MSLNNNVQDKNYIPLTPFKGWVLENFPFIEANFDAITNYELMCKLTEYLNNVISNQNQVQELGTELVTAYNELLEYVNNYFDNLDVQEEINNKLDDMVLDGSLTSLIGAYIQPRIDAQNVLITQVSNQYEDIQEQVTTNSNRISSFTHLTDGSTTGDAELIDARDGFNASTYSSAGDAIRGQCKNNSEQFNETINYYVESTANNTIEWELGTLANTSGNKQATNLAVRFKDFIKVQKGGIVKLSNYSTYSFKVFIYSSAEHTGSNLTYFTSDWQTEPVVIKNEGYLKVAIKNTTDIDDVSSVSQYFNGHIFTIPELASKYDLELAENKIDGANAEIEGLSNQFVDTYDISSLHWESGVIFTNGYKGNNLKCIRTVEFISCKKGSVIYLSDYSNAQFRVLVYAESEYQDPLEATAWKQVPYITQHDGFMKIVVYNPNVESIADDISDYAALVQGIIFTKEVIPEVYKLPTSWTENLTSYKKIQGINNAIAVQTDTHYSLENNDNANIGNDLKELTNYFGLDYICNLGDIIQGYQYNTLTDMKNSFTEIVHRYIDNCRCPFLYAVGNHEDCSLVPQAGGSHDLDGYILKDEIYANTIPFVNNTGEIVDNKKLYYYKDFDDYRVIVLNTRDIPYQQFDVDDININKHKISSEQISWFTNTALNTNKPVIIMCHVPLIDSLLPDANSVENAGQIISALESFASGGGTVIAVLSGHSHQQNEDKVNGINYITFKNGGMFAELLFIDITNGTITTKLIGDAPTGISNRSFTF